MSSLVPSLKITCCSYSLLPRDTLITFGKYKGKPLGTIPSKYLKWVSSNLRTGHTLIWAEMADKVLKDPFYQDRIEWEHAQRILSGPLHLRYGAIENAADELSELSALFGWDDEDKDAWKRVNFDFLGTTRGGRIPRKKELKDTPPQPKKVLLGQSTRLRRRERVKGRRTKGNLGGTTVQETAP